ncbi:MAG: helix-turn-helix domain-containing protein [Rhodobacterales bacterium]|nr:helix-turn-helix domain-containing protein [Rhodobacterales bacterium]
MTATALVPAYPRPPAQIDVYVEILGVELTVEFILAFGGAELHLSRDPKGKSRLEALVGYERAKALGQVSDRLQRRVPLVKSWTANYLAWKGMSVAEIARTLHTSDVSVRGWLNPKPRGNPTL